jgi:general L-amino acid transport system permease protein
MPHPSADQRTVKRWRSRAFAGKVYQALLLALLFALAWWLVSNTAANMKARGIQSGFDFLWQNAGFDIGEGLLDYDPGQPFWRAFAVGTLNTLRVALMGIVLTTLLGTLIGVGRLARNALVRALCSAYVELFRNIPLLLQLLMWYLLLTDVLPDVDQAWQVLEGAVFLSKGGLSFPVFEGGAWSVPTPGAFAMEGGGSLTPEFLALLAGLTLYTAAFVAEVVRSGLQAVPRGQTEAALSLGLSRAHVLRHVTLPQTLKVIVPPMTNQFLNLTKNSSLAVAIGYPDVVSIANTAINQTGRALECIAVIMAVYLCTSLLTAWLMSRLNQRALRAG